MSRMLWLGLAAALAGCSIPNTAFHASPDGGGSDSHSSVLSIVPSLTTVDVDEGATKDFTVTLNQAPSAPLTVSVATTATMKLGLSVPNLSFTPTNFAQPQAVTVSGLADPNTIDEHADVTLMAAGVDPVTVGANVHDLDKVSIVTDAGSTSVITIQEGGTTTVHVRLSAQPTGDVSVTAILGSGPVTVAPAMRVFTAANYDADQVFTFTAVADANTLSEDQSLTFRTANVPDKLLSIHDVDRDVQNIQVSPSSATITEQAGAATLNVSLFQQPSSNVTVTVTTTTGQAHIDIGQLTFTPQNYATTQSVQVDGPDDVDTADGSDTIHLKATDPDSGTQLDRTVTITIRDNDVQQILDDAPSPLAVTETTMATFNATLKFKPAANVIVSVTSLDGNVATASPGTLTFTPTDYNQPHPVIVSGLRDNNLAANTTSIRLFEAAIGMTDVPVSVADVDRQTIVLSSNAVSVPEGLTRTFDVSLMFDPGTTVTVSLANTNPTALPIDKSSITFTTTNFATPGRVTVSPPIDSNSVSETATITATGAGAVTSATVTLTAMDATVVQTWGWPTAFPSTILVPATTVVAYLLDVGAVANVDSFHTYVPSANGSFRMALYTNVANAPGALVAEMPAGKVLTNGPNDGPIFNGPLLMDPTYFLVIRFSQDVNVGYAPAGVTGRQCIRNFGIAVISDPWPPNFGAAACTVDRLINISLTTYHQ